VTASLALASLCLPGARLRAQTLGGTLLDRDTSLPIGFARLVLISESGDSVTATLSNAGGLFSLKAPRPGSYYLKASSLGYQERTVGIFDLGPGGEMSIEFRLPPKPLTLEEIVVRATGRPVQQGALIRNGFYDRMTAGLGRFITPAEIAKSPARRVSDLFYGVGRVEVVPDGGRNRVMMMNPMGPCVPPLYLDGIPVINDGDLDAMVLLPDVEAIEVYRGSAELPLQYGGTGGACGAILIWTKGAD
jgi:hypothetical protein